MEIYEDKTEKNAYLSVRNFYYRHKILFSASLTDLSDAVCYVRDRAEEWCVDADKVVVCGFSAGGHLAASLGVFWNSEKAVMRADKKNRPNGLILSYPVITSGEYSHKESIANITNGDKELMALVSLEDRVTKDCPPTFIWHTYTDQSVPVQNSLLFASALAKAGISAELHIFPTGSHGLALSKSWTNGEGQEDAEEAGEWMRMACRYIDKL